MQQSIFWGLFMYLLGFVGCGDDYYSEPPYVDQPYTEEYYDDGYVDDGYYEEEVNHEERYTESLAKWEESKKTYNNSYIYTLDYSSYEGNFGYSTTLVIKKGKIEERRYQSYKFKDDGQKVIDKMWTETKGKVGKNKEGFPAKTMDELYADCGNNYIKVDKSLNQIVFEPDYSGILTMCGYWPNDCEDDCYEGVTISSFSWVE